MSDELSRRSDALIDAHKNGVDPASKLQANYLVQNEILTRAEEKLARKTLWEECMDTAFYYPAFSNSKDDLCNDIASKLLPDYMEKQNAYRKLTEKSLRPNDQNMPEVANQFVDYAGSLVDVAKPYIEGIAQLYRRVFSD